MALIAALWLVHQPRRTVLTIVIVAAIAAVVAFMPHAGAGVG